MPNKRVCVFSGTSSGNNPLYAQHAAELGEEIARRGYELVYGGGSTGLLGACSQAVIKNGGKVISVIPEPFKPKELSGESMGYTITTEDMHSRKEIMASFSDMLIALPGGVGTTEELSEMICWSYLGIHRKPVGLLSTLGYYDHLLAHLENCIASGFTPERFRNVWHTSTEPAALLDLVESAVPPVGLLSTWKPFPAALAAMAELEEHENTQKSPTRSQQVPEKHMIKYLS